MKTSTRYIALLTAGAVCAACSPENGGIAEDGVYFGQLLMTGPQLEDGSQFAEHSIELVAGQELDVILQSSDFDTYLRIEDPSGNLLGEDDDSAGGTNSQLVVIAPVDGTYRLVASSFTSDDYGEYLLAVRRSMSDDTSVVFTGELPEGGGKSLSASAWPMHEVSAATGETLNVRLASSAFDAYVELRDARGNVLAEDDDSGGGTNAMLNVPVLRSGTVRARAMNAAGPKASVYCTP